MRPQHVLAHLGLVAAAGCAISGGADSRPAPTTETIRALTDELGAAWQQLNPDSYLDWFANDVDFYFEGQRVERHEFEAAVRATTAALRSSTFEITSARVRILGRDAAAISFLLREMMEGTTGATTEIEAAMTFVWTWRPEGWRVVVAHESLPAPPATPR